MTEPLAACLVTSRLWQTPSDCRYSPVLSRQASRSPKSEPFVRCGVSAEGRAPLAGTSHSRLLLDFVAVQAARMVLLFHQRAGVQPSAVSVPGTFSRLITPPALLTSCGPFGPGMARVDPLGAYAAV